MADYAVIGGSGLTSLSNLEITGSAVVDTPFGTPSSPLLHGLLAGVEVVFLPRHGDDHRLAPHRINYRANVWALREAGVRSVIAVNAVGGIHPELGPGRLAIPVQIIDYTWGREHTFHDPEHGEVVHVDFSFPYTESLRKVLVRAAAAAGVDVHAGGIYGATQGPRLESAGEIERMARDGCDLVGMTGMPEAALAREAGLDYASCALVVNHAAGIGDGEITMDEIRTHLECGMSSVRELIAAAIAILSD